ARDSFGRIELNDDLQRALHTLKGSAQMAAVTPIADVVMPVEHLVKEMRAAQLGADSEVLDLLDTTASLLQAGLAQLDSTPYAALPGTDEWIARVAMIYHDRLDNPQTDGAGAEDDGAYSPALLNRFLGDAIEQVSAVADDITLWAGQRLGDERQHTLAATLSQVADAAENLGINAVSELAQALQVLLRNGADRPLPGPDFFAVTQAAAEELIDMFDRLAANQEPQANETMVQRLQDFEFPPEPPVLDMSDAVYLQPGHEQLLEPQSTELLSSDLQSSDLQSREELAAEPESDFEMVGDSTFDGGFETAFAADDVATFEIESIEPAATLDAEPVMDEDADLAAFVAELASIEPQQAGIEPEPAQIESDQAEIEAELVEIESASAPVETALIDIAAELETIEPELLPIDAADDLNDFADLDAFALDDADDLANSGDDDHLLAIDDMEGETIDLKD